MTPATFGPLSYGDAAAPRVVLFHGLSGAPSELAPLARALGEAGFRAEVPLLPGHGTRPEDLVAVDADDVLAFARRTVEERPPAIVCGLSMGALVALVAAARVPGLSALVLVAPAARMAGPTAIFDALGHVPWPAGLPLLVPKGRPGAGPTGDGRYDRLPLRWSRELRRVRERAREAAGWITAPSLVVHGLADRTADPASAIEVSGWLARTRAEVRFLAGAPHLVALSPAAGELAREVVTFASRALVRPAKTA